MDDVIERRALEWMAGNDTGVSSKALAKHMLGLPVNESWCHPHDGADLGRCLRLLDLIPEWRPRILEMGDVSPMWKVLAEHWDELATMHRADSEKLYSRMQELLRPVEDASGRVVRLSKGMSMIFGK